MCAWALEYIEEILAIQKKLDKRHQHCWSAFLLTLCIILFVNLIAFHNLKLIGFSFVVSFFFLNEFSLVNKVSHATLFKLQVLVTFYITRSVLFLEASFWILVFVIGYRKLIIPALSVLCIILRA